MVSSPLREALRATATSEYQRVEATSPPARLSLDELRAGQLAWRSAIRSLGGEFVYELDRQLELPIDQDLKKQGRLVPSDLTYRVRFAIAGEKRFEEYEPLTPQTNAAQEFFRGKPVSFIEAFNGRESRAHEPYRAIGTVQQGKTAGMMEHAIWYFQAINVILGTEAERERQTELYIPTALSRTWQYRVLPQLEIVDGWPCHVVVSNRDAIWIDHEHGFVCRRRVWLDLVNARGEPGSLQFVKVCRDFKEVALGVWLPSIYYCLHYSGRDVPQQQQEKIASLDKVIASTLQVNDVPESKFEIEYPPGTQVMDLIQNISYTVPKGEAQLERAIAGADPIINGTVVPRGVAMARSYTRWLWVGNAVLAACLAALVFYRYLRARQARHV